MASSPVVFPYKFAGGRLSPIVSAGIRLNGRWQVAELYVDSGAFYTLLHATFAASFGFDYKKGRRILMQVGDGGMIPVYLHELPMQLGVIEFQVPLGFSERLGVGFNPLGRLGVFEHFRICFHERRRVVSFQPMR